MSEVGDDKLKWTWDPKRGRLVNLTKPALQNKGAPQEGVEGAWRCTGCKNVNFGTRDSCHRCSTPKPPQHILDERIWAIQSGQAPSARWPNGAPKEGVGDDANALPVVPVPVIYPPGAIAQRGSRLLRKQTA